MSVWGFRVPRGLVVEAKTAVRERWKHRHCPRIPAIYEKYRDLTMISPQTYMANLRLAHEHRAVPGAVVECGVWRGGMIAGIAEVLGKGREYVLFDSFEGLPAPSTEDGEFAANWSRDGDSPFYFDNCRADEATARMAMARAGVDRPTIFKGRFEHTVKSAGLHGPIAVLRLDGDWYSSTLVCLRELFPRMAKGGIVILDDYGFWRGATRAIHEFLESTKGRIHLRQRDNLVFYLKRTDEDPAQREDGLQRGRLRR